MKTKTIQFVDIGKAAYSELETADPTENDVVVNMRYTTISNGTERDCLLGRRGSAALPYDPDEKPGGFPRILGYSGSGVVEWAGKAVTSVRVGDRVACSSGTHRKHLVRPEQLVTKIPDSLSLSDAALCHIANFPLGAVRKAEVEIGQSALVAGLGILGIFSVQYLRICGAYPVIAADPKPERREMALRFGADFALDPTRADYVSAIRDLTEGRMIQAAIEVTGVGAALDQTLDCMARLGTVALLGCTRDPHFTIDYYRKVHYPGIRLVGAHAGARPPHDSFRGYWTEKEDVETVIRLAAGGRLALGALVQETHAPAEAPEVYARLVSDPDFPVCVQFDWQNET